MLALLSSVNFARRLMPSVIGSFTYFGFALLTTDATMRRTAASSTIQAPNASVKARATASLMWMPTRRFISPALSPRLVG
jgi:hypothetical protein